MKRAIVAGLEKLDEAIDEIAYRPTVVKAFMWVPRWWQCDLARLSVRLEERWDTGFWDWDWIVPGATCEACGRRASIHLYGGPIDDEPDDYEADDTEEDIWAGSVLSDRAIHLCGWCHLQGPILTEEDLARELRAARADSIAWRWRWRVRAS